MKYLGILINKVFQIIISVGFITDVIFIIIIIVMLTEIENIKWYIFILLGIGAFSFFCQVRATIKMWNRKSG